MAKGGSGYLPRFSSGCQEGASRSQVQVAEGASRSQAQAAEGASRSQAQAADEGVSRSQAQAADEGVSRSQAQAADEGVSRSQAQVAEGASKSQAQAAEGASRSQAQAAEGATGSQAQAAEEGASRSQAQAAEEGASRSQEQAPEEGASRSQAQVAEGRSQAQAADEGVSRSHRTQAAEVGAFRSQAQVPARKNDVALRSDAQIAHEGHTFNTRSKQEGVELYRLRADAEVFVPSGFPSEPPGHKGESASSPGVIRLGSGVTMTQRQGLPLQRLTKTLRVRIDQPCLGSKGRGGSVILRAGHWPYRKDCQVCVRGSAVGLQHRKSK